MSVTSLEYDIKNIEKGLGGLLDPRNRDILETILNEQYENTPLRTIMFDPTHYCNFNCPGCIEDEGRKVSNLSKFSLDRIKELFYEMSSESIKGIGFYGGEPCSYPYFPEALSYAYNLGFNVRVVTNGSYLTKDSVKRAIVDGKDRIDCRVSINSGKEDTHRNIHRLKKSCFNRIIQGIYDITYEGVGVGVSFLVEEDNHKEIFDAAQISKQCGCEFIEIRPKTYVHSKGLVPLIENTRSEIDYQITNAKNNLEDENFKVKVPRWYMQYIENNNHPSTDKPYDKCFVSLFRITVSPPDPGTITMCAYQRGMNNFISSVDNQLGEWAKKQRVNTFKKINPSVDCSDIICNRDEMNRALHTIVNEHKDGNCIIENLQAREINDAFML